MLRIRWSERDYSMRECADVFRGSLPILCKATKGFYGPDDLHKISTNETYLIYGIQSEPRLVAKTTDGHYVSVPMDYPLNLEIMSRLNTAASRITVREAVERSRKDGSKFRVRFADDQRVPFTKNSDFGGHKRFGTMDELHVHDQIYLLAYPVVDDFVEDLATGWPAYMNVTLVVAEGFLAPHDDDNDEFTEFMCSLSQARLGFKRHPLATNKEVIVFNEEPNLSEKMDRGSSDSRQHPAAGASQSAPEYDQVDFDDVQEASGDFAKAFKKSAKAMKGTMTATIRTMMLKVKKASGGGRPSVVANPHDYDAISFHAPSDTNIYETLTKDGELPSKRPKSPDEDDDEDHVKPKPSSPAPRVPPPIVPRSPGIRPADNATADLQHDAARRQPPRRPSTADDPSETGPKPPPVAPRSSTTKTRVQQPSPSASRPPPIPPSPSSRTPGPAGRATPCAVPSSGWKTAADVPADVDVASWTMDQVSDCLLLLKLEPYVERFQEEDVDGQLLVGMDATMLTEQFGLSSFKALKLMRFVHEGWRPS